MTMGTIETRLRQMGYELPPAFVFPKANRTGCTQTGTLLLLSGHGLDLPKLPGVRQTGKLGADMTAEEGYATARAVALTMLATIKAHCGDLDRVQRVLRLFGMCNCVGYAAARGHRQRLEPLLWLWGPEFSACGSSAVDMLRCRAASRWRSTAVRAGQPLASICRGGMNRVGSARPHGRFPYRPSGRSVSARLRRENPSQRLLCVGVSCDACRDVSKPSATSSCARQRCPQEGCFGTTGRQRVGLGAPVDLRRDPKSLQAAAGAVRTRLKLPAKPHEHARERDADGELLGCPLAVPPVSHRIWWSEFSRP
jgi:hypothetical protein